MKEKTSPQKGAAAASLTGRARLQDVAEAAGVSISSVSNFLNGRQQKIGAEARQRIEAAIEALEFRPNQAALQLKTGRANMVALLVPSVINPFIAEMVLAIEQAAFRSGLGVHICNTMRKPEIERRFLDTLSGNGITNVLTVGPLLKNNGPSVKMRRNWSIVAIDANREDMGLSHHVDTINLDHEAAIIMAVDHLYELGHRNIGYVTDPAFTFSRAMRLCGFQKAMKQHGLQHNTVITMDREPDIAEINMIEVGRNATKRVLGLKPRITAIIAFNDMIALGLQTGLRAAGVSVPEDVSIVGVDNIWAGHLSSPALTTVRQPINAMVDAAMDRVVNATIPRVGSGSDTTFQPELIIRETTLSPRSKQ